MRISNFKSATLKSALAAALLLSASGAAFAQAINLTAGRTNTTVSDGSLVPMWGYSCGAGSGSTATCAALNPNAGSAAVVTPPVPAWSPVVITVPVDPTTGLASLDVNLTNNLSVPTSLVIVGQIGGGLGAPVYSLAPVDHSGVRSQTWPIASNTAVTDPTQLPPAQTARVRSFATEVAANGGTAKLSWPALRPGTYLIQSGSHPSIQEPMGLYGLLVVTSAPTIGAAGCAYPVVVGTNTTCSGLYAAEVPLLFSEIDPVQNTAVDTAVATTGFSEDTVWAGGPNGCGAHYTCYPPTINYTPLYYLINGVTFDPTKPSNSVFAATTGTSTGVLAAGTNMLVRLANAGLKMHVPTIVGAATGTSAQGIALVAEDGNVLPGQARIQSEVFLAAGKTTDVMVNVPATPANATRPPALPVYDRELSLSANGVGRNGGMLAYIGASGVVAPTAGTATAVALDDTYNALVAGVPLTISDPSKGVIANDTNVQGVTLLTQATNGIVGLNRDGTLTYTPNAGSTATSDSFTYCANGSVIPPAGTPGAVCSTGITAKVTLGASNVLANSGVTCTAPMFTSAVATSFAAQTPGLLAGCVDAAKLPVTVDPTSVVSLGGMTVVAAANGGFTATAPGAGTYKFTFQAKNSLGLAATPTTATVVFPAPSNLSVKVLDGADHTTPITDYRWIIEEDRTFYVDPACTQNPLPANCPTISPSVTNPINYGTNFHTSSMPVVAAGCTGPLSCESGQTLQKVNVVCDVGNGVCRPGTQQAQFDPSQVLLDPSKRYYISILPGDGANPFIGGNASAPVNCAAGPYVTDPVTGLPTLNTDCGHGMGGAPIAAACGPLSAGKIACALGAVGGFDPVTVLTVPTPFPTATLSVFVFEDDYPLNGEHGSGGGVDVLAPREGGLGEFQVTIFDQAGGTGDATGQPTYDMLNQPLSNSLAGTIDPVNGLDACPISKVASANSAANAIQTSLTIGSATFSFTPPVGVPVALKVGMALSDSAGAVPAGTTVASITGTGTVTVTMSSPATATTSDTVNANLSAATGMIVTCPKYESDGQTLSPMAGQAVVKNLYPGRYGIAALPGASRVALGEEWVQTNTLDGQKAHDSFMRIGEPGYFQEFGPAGYHVSIGFANPKIINDRRNNDTKSGMCDPLPNGGALTCTFTVTGTVTGSRLSRAPDNRLYSSGDRSSLAFTQCYVSLGDPDGAEFAFAKCDADGNFVLKGIPAGNWKVTTFDQWNDQIIDGITQPVAVGCANNLGGLCTAVNAVTPTGNATCGGARTSASTCDMGEIGVHQWQANIYTRSFIDMNGDGVSQDPGEPGLALVATNVRFRDGSYSNFNNTDLNGYAGFNEVFPLFNWYTIESDSTRYKSTGTHVIYDAGGPADGSASCGDGTNGNPLCGNSASAAGLANTYENFPLPADLSVPGAVYCASGADCSAAEAASFALGKPIPSSTTTHSTGRIDPPFWFGSYGWQGYIGQGNFLEFGKKPFAQGETGPIHGHVIYASTRPFDDPKLLLQLSWEPLVAHVRVNLYQEGLAADGVTKTFTLVDHTETTSWDDWVQGFRKDAAGNIITDANGNAVPNMNCPGQQGSSDPFFYALQNQPQYLDWYNSQHGGPPAQTIAHNAQYKCYDGMHTWNQLQPAPYDGMYSFPSVTGINSTTGKPLGTNCDPKVCVPNPDATDPYRSRAPMLPPGKYVVEVVVPAGYELVKEEDKNILIGDNYIAPAAVQIPGLASAVYILPDQATLAATYNPLNPQNATSSLGRNSALPSHEGDTGSDESFWPCVGEVRQVPDFISLFPQSGEVAPFAGAFRPLCDRKEVSLDPQSSVLTKFYIFSSTHVAAHFQGIILDDFAAEFDPFSPQFGEKFAPAYVPVGVKDWTGNAVNRVYTDQFGLYNGLNYSTWEVNPPNPTGYGPTMMTMCMNDAGLGGTPDPLFQPGYSQFCYELPFMPGQTGYFDTPVVPVQAFASGSYNTADCSYPDATPAIASVTGDVAGPWVGASGSTLTINALGDQSVDWYGYSGPSQNTAPWNQKKITRHYGFGGSAGTVTIGGVVATVAPGDWSDTTIKVTVPQGVPACAVQQQAVYGGSSAQCGQLVVTTAAGKQSVDTVAVTIGGKAPTVLASGATIQSAIDAAAPGDLIIIPPGTYNEMLVMWKPVRLQGVGAASSVVDANTQPAGKLLNPWREKVVCLFGLSGGRPDTSANRACLNGLNYATNSEPGNGGYVNFPNLVVDRLPLEATLGWDAGLNGNLAEQLIEPSLLGAYEGATITVVAKGVKFPTGTQILDAFGQTTATPAAFPDNSVFLTSADCETVGNQTAYPSNFYCNPSSIDGLGIRDSSQGGGGIFVHAYAHNLQIANNRVSNNQGTMSGGMTIGAGEHGDIQIQGSAPTTYPASCETSSVANASLPFCFNMAINIHNNAVARNSSLGDEIFSSTPAGAGGISINTGADYYKVTNNWVCGNLSSGDGGGISHIGFSKNGVIEHNTILFNQTTNPTITTNGGGLLVMGAPDADPTTCGVSNDQDCLATPGSIPPSDGTGQGLVINANLILGNAADSGSGGGVRIQHLNGTDVLNLPNGASACSADLKTCSWSSVSLTNNIIVNNVAGWDGGGLSLLDALAANIVNNTIVSNDSTASSGTLFQSLFAPLASSVAPTGSVTGSQCGSNDGQSCPQVAGLVSVSNSPVLQANITALPAGAFSCPTGHGTGTGPGASCFLNSIPLLFNDAIYQNRSFYIGVGGIGSGSANQNQQHVVALFNRDGTPAGTQGSTGACPAASYWELGFRGDTGPTANDASGFAPIHSLLSANVYGGSGNAIQATGAAFTSQYCNGSRQPPELGAGGYAVPPGVNEFNAFPNPVFSLTPSGVVDEGNNWVNVRWGPLALTSPFDNHVLGDFTLPSTSSAISTGIATVSGVQAPTPDFFGTPRTVRYDAGAVQYSGPLAAGVVSPTSLTFGGTLVGSNSAAQTLTMSNVGNAIEQNIAVAVTGPFSVVNNCGVTLAAGASCTISVTFAPTVYGAATGSVIVTSNVSVTGSPVALSGIGQAPLTITARSANMAYGGAVPVITPIYAGFVGTDTAASLATQPTCSTTATSASPAGNYPSSCTGAVAANYQISYVPGTVTVAQATTTTTITAQTPNPSAVNSAVNVSVHVAPQFSGLPTGTATVRASTGEICTATLGVGGNGSCALTLTSATCLTGRTLTATYNGDLNFLPSAPSAGVAHTVTFPVPTLTSISPTTGVQGGVYAETLAGTGLTCTSGIPVNNGGITRTNITVVNDTTVTATFTVSAGAALGIHNVRVTTPGGTSALPGVPFTVTSPGLPGLTSVVPNTFVRGTTTTVTLNGTNFTTNGTSVAVNGGGINISAINVTSATSLTATFTVTNFADVTVARNVTVTNPAGTSNGVAITVQGPTLASINPTTGIRGTSVPVTFTGTNLGTATGLTGLPFGVAVANGTFTPGATTVTATLNIATNAALVTANIGVATTIGNSGTKLFTVQGATLASVTPSSGARGTTVPVVLTGTNLAGATAVNIPGGGVNCSGIASTATTVNANCTINAGAGLSVRNVTVITPIGNVTLPLAFTVVSPPVATMTSINPNSSTTAQRGTTVAVTLVGTNFTTGSAVTVSGTGITVNSVVVVDSTHITANFAIGGGGGGSLGAHNVAVRNASTTPSNSVTFTKN